MKNVKMKDVHPARLKTRSYLIIIVFQLLISSCSWNVPAEYQGKWQTAKTRITVRTKTDLTKFHFTSDSASVMVEIHGNKTASGSIGLAGFRNVKIRKNPGLPLKTGVSYIIECGKIGKIFENDPLISKEVEIWLGPVSENRTFEAELRYTEGWAVFPMAGLLFSKEDSIKN